jgi:CheY-like chemotaxis protein
MPHKLLLADDSVTIQRVIELTFADEDIHVTVVGDGRQAIERVRADRPDIVLADIGMPERDGYEVAAFIKGDPRLAHIPVLLLTGAFEPLDEDRARLVGCDGVLVKPFEPQMVINRVRELLSGRRPVAAAVSPSPPSRSEADIFGDDLDAGFAPPPAAADPRNTGDALEDYFDRLDAAFANISGPAGRPGKPSEPDEDLSGGISELQQAPPERAPGQDPMASWDPDLTADPGPAQPHLGPAAPHLGPAAPHLGPATPHLANTFAALLAAEQGDFVPQPGAGFLEAPHLGDDVIEDIVGRVIARMTDDVVRRTVLETAERLVREEIDRIKREARASGGPQGPQGSR